VGGRRGHLKLPETEGGKGKKPAGPPQIGKKKREKRRREECVSFVILRGKGGVTVLSVPKLRPEKIIRSKPLLNILPLSPVEGNGGGRKRGGKKKLTPAFPSAERKGGKGGITRSLRPFFFFFNLEKEKKKEKGGRGPPRGALVNAGLVPPGWSVGGGGRSQSEPPTKKEKTRTQK